MAFFWQLFFYFLSVLAFLAIYRQIRDFGPSRGDSNLALAIDRQSPKIGDFEPQKLAKLAIFNINQRFRQFSLKICNFKNQNLEFSAKNRLYFLFKSYFFFCVKKIYIMKIMTGKINKFFIQIIFF